MKITFFKIHKKRECNTLHFFHTCRSNIPYECKDTQKQKFVIESDLKSYIFLSSLINDPGSPLRQIYIYIYCCVTFIFSSTICNKAVKLFFSENKKLEKTSCLERKCVGMTTGREGFQKNSVHDSPTEYILDCHWIEVCRIIMKQDNKMRTKKHFKIE